MSAAFTPAPWLASSKKRGGWNILGADGELRYIAVVDDNDFFYSPPANEANARLIASAPELYEALIEARAALWAIEDSAVESGFDKLGDIIADRLTKANAAIAKARGEQVQP